MKLNLTLKKVSLQQEVNCQLLITLCCRSDKKEEEEKKEEIDLKVTTTFTAAEV